MKKIFLLAIWLCVQSVCVAQSEERFYGSAGSLSFESFSGTLKGKGKLKKRGVNDKERFEGVTFYIGTNGGRGKLQGHAFTRNLSGDISEIKELETQETGGCIATEIYYPVAYLSASFEGGGKGKTSSTPNYDAQGVYTPNVQREMASKNHKVDFRFAVGSSMEKSPLGIRIGVHYRSILFTSNDIQTSNSSNSISFVGLKEGTGLPSSAKTTRFYWDRMAGRVWGGNVHLLFSPGSSVMFRASFLMGGLSANNDLELKSKGTERMLDMRLYVAGGETVKIGFTLGGGFQNWSVRSFNRPFRSNAGIPSVDVPKVKYGGWNINIGLVFGWVKE